MFKQHIKETILNNRLQMILSVIFISVIVFLTFSLFNAQTVYTGLDKTIIRSSANRHSNRIGTLKQFQKVHVLYKKNNWYRIRFQDTKLGWIPIWLTNRNFPKGQVETPLSESIIVLDPGHGGNDAGALTSNKKHDEKVYTLKNAQAIYKKLDESGAKVEMTRNNDSFVDLASRPQLSNKLKADAFISIHYDSSDVENTATGDTTYYYRKKTSYDLANDINNGLKNNVKMDNKGVQFADYQVLRDNKQPAVLVEGGYINTDKDYKKIASKNYENEISTAIFEGLTKFLQDN